MCISFWLEFIKAGSFYTSHSFLLDGIAACSAFDLVLKVTVLLQILCQAMTLQINYRVLLIVFNRNLNLVFSLKVEILGYDRRMCRLFWIYVMASPVCSHSFNLQVKSYNLSLVSFDILLKELIFVLHLTFFLFTKYILCLYILF